MCIFNKDPKKFLTGKSRPAKMFLLPASTLTNSIPPPPNTNNLQSRSTVLNGLTHLMLKDLPLVGTITISIFQKRRLRRKKFKMNKVTELIIEREGIWMQSFLRTWTWNRYITLFCLYPLVPFFPKALAPNVLFENSFPLLSMRVNQ